jgi:hypothetical protein
MGLAWFVRGTTAGEPVPDQAFDAIRNMPAPVCDRMAGAVTGQPGGFFAGEFR